MKLSRLIIAMLFLLGIASGVLLAENLQISFANLVNGCQIDECQNFIVKFNASVENETVDDVWFYANNIRVAWIRDEPWEYEWQVPASGYYQLFAITEDKAHNEAFTDTIIVYVGDVEEYNLVLNSYFTCNTEKWRLQKNNTQGTLEWIADADISEGGAAYISITEGSDTDWHLQLYQLFPIDSAHTYEISFACETPEEKIIQWAMQQNSSPYDHYSGQTVTVSGNDFYGPFEFVAPKTDPDCAFKFFVGGNTVPIYFDDVVILDREVEFPDIVDDVEETENRSPENFSLIRCYPNPFNNTAMIRYSLPVYCNVDLKILNIRGELVKNLVHSHQGAGEHYVHWNGSDETGMSMSSGTYLVQLATKIAGITRIQTTKIMLVE